MERKRISSQKKVGLALHVNRESGQPMLESTCECGFLSELESDEMLYETQVEMSAGGKGSKAKPDYRVDFLLNGKMIVELKGCCPPTTQESE